jgi:hypothetical protein
MAAEIGAAISHIPVKKPEPAKTLSFGFHDLGRHCHTIGKRVEGSVHLGADESQVAIYPVALQRAQGMAEPHLKSGGLVQVLGRYAAGGPPISVLFPSNRHFSSKVRVFIDTAARILDRNGEQRDSE